MFYIIINLAQGTTTILTHHNTWFDSDTTNSTLTYPPRTIMQGQFDPQSTDIDTTIGGKRSHTTIHYKMGKRTFGGGWQYDQSGF